jgi:hypothetical protein
VKTAPTWMLKHPCVSCGQGYGLCSQTWTMSLQCCKDCSHPTRSQPDPWTADDLEEMWAGRDDVPPQVVESIARLRSAPAHESPDQ